MQLADKSKSNFTGSNDDMENTLNQLLTEMDGFGTNTNVIVILQQIVQMF